MITRVTIEIDEMFEPMIELYIDALRAEYDSGMEVKRKKNAIVFEPEDPLEPNEMLCDRLAEVFAQVDEELAAE